ncbi:Hypothetical protein CINCED_3A020021 [Cinara cedri]|uniref:Adenosine 5'-monophosphoramidase HINT3 n=1 Tax=Cinara cedri TaxID=506608 RepID=A0A5E4M6W0_9HEMI|nr:Hypothetical protein CINCED_3A020021 [Cinara cedri]
MSEETINDNANEMVESYIKDHASFEVKHTKDASVVIISQNTNETSEKYIKNTNEIIYKSTDKIINNSIKETVNKNIEIVNINITELNNISTDKTPKSCEENCIFCNIIATNDSSVILEPQSDQFVIIRDIKPVATNHFLILSRKHIQSAKELQPCEEDRNLLKNMIRAANEILINNRCDLNYTRMGFHWPPFYTIAHMHLHAISPVNSMSMFNRFLAFNPSFSYVFVDVRIKYQTINY